MSGFIELDMTEPESGPWEYMGEFARGPRQQGDPPRYRLYRNSDRSKVALLRVWPDPESAKTLLASADDGGELKFDFPQDLTADGDLVPWSQRDQDTARRAVLALINRPAMTTNSGAAHASLDLL